MTWPNANSRACTGPGGALQSAQGARIRLRGRELLNFASNDYLNLAADPRLAQAAARAARRYGCGAGASPLVAGYLPPHRSLERALARWEGDRGRPGLQQRLRRQPGRGQHPGRAARMRSSAMS